MIADAEELIPRRFRTQIHCETSVDVSSEDEEKVEARDEQPWEEAQDTELAVLQPVHLATPSKLQRRVSVNDVEVQRARLTAPPKHLTAPPMLQRRVSDNDVEIQRLLSRR